MPQASNGTADATTAAVRRFNRFYTRRIGVLRETLLDSSYSLTEVRVLFELAHREVHTAKTVAAELGIDAGYLSRILQRLRDQRLIAQKPAPDDARQRLLALTAAGRRTFEALDVRATAEVTDLLSGLSRPDRTRLIDAFDTVEALLDGPRERTIDYVLRPHQPGDIGWVIERNGAIYAREYGWNAEYEALVARIAAQFLERFDPARERCWIAERDGERIGCVFLVQRSGRVAQLRLLLVESSARGLGIGSRLVDECELFARQVGYRKIMLWTNSVLRDARRIYQRAGYRLTKEQPAHQFGRDLVGQIWEKPLS